MRALTNGVERLWFKKMNARREMIKEKSRTPIFNLLVLWIILLVATTLAGCRHAKPKPLPSFNADLGEISVSGISSGGHMAVQFEVAHAALIKGAGVIAGGPYYCAQDDITKAISECACLNPLKACPSTSGRTDVQHLVQVTSDNAIAGSIDPVSFLSRHRVFLFSGTQDKIVPQAIMDDLESYYRNFIPEAHLLYAKDIPAQHSMVTDSYGQDCGKLGKPFINNCGYDTAGELLKHIYGKLNPRNTGKLRGSFIEFDQEEFLRNPESHSMDHLGWIYVPESCGTGQKCRVHVAFHGCLQGRTSIGMEFIEHAGYNQWADTNNILVLYPQAIAKTSFGLPGMVADLRNANPQGCWNWWGYDNDANYATKSGHQITAVKRMIDRIAGTAPRTSSHFSDAL